MHKRIFITLSFFILLSFLSVKDASAATLKFDPATLTTAPNTNFSVNVVLDAGTEQIAGSDIYIKYDQNLLTVQSVTSGDYFPIVNNIPSAGRVYISGVIATQNEYKTGSGTVATINFKSLKESSVTVTYDCDLTKTDTSKISQNDINATNVINCGGNGQLIVTVSASAAGTTPGVGGPPSGSLPESGVVDKLMQYSGLGIFLLFSGAVLRMLAR